MGMGGFERGEVVTRLRPRRGRAIWGAQSGQAALNRQGQSGQIVHTESDMPLLLCPNDNASMQTVSRNGVEFDMCPTCRGVWLDRGEL